jgi:hypothetical protein
LPDIEMPASFHPQLIHTPLPIAKTVGSSGTAYSIATSSSWYERGMSLLCATSTWSSRVEGGTATRSVHRPVSRRA